MADKKDAKKPSGGGGLKNDVEVLSTIFIAIIVLSVIAGIIGGIERRLGTSFDDFSFSSLGSFFRDTLSENTPLGTLVIAHGEASVWKTAARSILAGTQESGALGRLTAGPVFDDGATWWRVDFEQDPDGWVDADELRLEGGFLARVKRIYMPIAWTLSILGCIGLLYFAYRWSIVMREHRAQMRVLEQKLSGTEVSERNARFEHILDLVSSENPGDWRVAIVEADIMLDTLLADMGYDGDTVGDKLKRVEKSDMTTLDLAWEAHKVRNNIAHRGSDFILTHREAKRVVDLYRQAFEEFDVV